MREQIRPPYYHETLDWKHLTAEYEPPFEFMTGARLWSPERIAEVQLARLQAAVQRASEVPFYQKLWSENGFTPSDIRSLDDLKRMPSYTIDDIRDSIERKPPMGDYQGLGLEDGAHTPLRLYTSGGTTGTPRPTIYSQWDREVGAILSARTFYMQGVRPGDAVINAWAYSTHNAAWIMDHALWQWLGAIPITTSTGNVTPTEKQIEFARLYGAASITATSDYLLHIADTARRMGLDPAKDFNFKTILSFGDTKAVEEAFGVPTYDSYAFHEVQYVAAECEAKDGLHIFEDAFIIEIVDFETGEPLPPGHKGNIVVTALYKTGTSQLRYNIQDISASYELAQCACGSWHKKLDYFQGRSDTMVKLRGVNVWPEACGKIISGHPGINGEYYCYVERVQPDGKPARDEMTIMVERVDGAGDSDRLREELAQLLKQKTGVAIGVELVERDGLRELTGHGHRAKLKRFEDRRGSIR
ncbi:phenylacetate--CoA ligase family protein [Mycetocola miduiensis]|uniref:Phenylacetate-CoA ligase n=1 Tax=Mycetocola miduiensis TaxID=995034 RepID=A0A1I5C6M9_9MICO|nr:phenylacetate--CoA ligase family protein [Mycetocola miduiensis]SFN82740.1 phenylacetate-CoA ligase [Mycetocola miduiensis]